MFYEITVPAAWVLFAIVILLVGTAVVCLIRKQKTVVANSAAEPPILGGKAPEAWSTTFGILLLVVSGALLLQAGPTLWNTYNLDRYVIVTPKEPSVYDKIGKAADNLDLYAKTDDMKYRFRKEPDGSFTFSVTSEHFRGLEIAPPAAVATTLPTTPSATGAFAPLRDEAISEAKKDGYKVEKILRIVISGNRDGIARIVVRFDGQDPDGQDVSDKGVVLVQNLTTEESNVWLETFLQRLQSRSHRITGEAKSSSPNPGFRSKLPAFRKVVVD